MKRYIKIIAAVLTLALAAASVACASAATETTTPLPMDTEAQPNGEASGEITGSFADAEKEKAEYAFYRVEYHSGDEQHKIEPIVITSSKDFAELVLPNLPKTEQRAAEEKYNEAFFEKYHLVMFFVTYSSGSVQPTVASVEQAEGTITVTVEGVMEGDVGTCDMATHMGIVVLENERYPLESEIVIAGAKTEAGRTEKE